MEIIQPLLTQITDPVRWQSLCLIDMRDFEILNLKHPGCGEFKELKDWNTYFYKYLRGLDKMPVYISEFTASPRHFIQHYARIARGENV